MKKEPKAKKRKAAKAKSAAQQNLMTGVFEGLTMEDMKEEDSAESEEEGK